MNTVKPSSAVSFAIQKKSQSQLPIPKIPQTITGCPDRASCGMEITTTRWPRTVVRGAALETKGGPTMVHGQHNWTNPSVLALAQGNADPVAVIIEKGRAVVLDAVEKGWSGPPFDPFRLADELRIPVTPRDDVLDARLVPSGARGRIEFNPNRPSGRIRFSLAHEIAHTLFPGYSTEIRQRGPSRGDTWQVELLCNIAAAELLMPIGTAVELEDESVDIDNLMRLRKQFDVSTEALFLRMARRTTEPCAIFAASRIANGEEVANFRVDYSAPSRSWSLEMPADLQVSGSLALSECTAVGYTTKRFERWGRELPELGVE